MTLSKITRPIDKFGSGWGIRIPVSQPHYYE